MVTIKSRQSPKRAILYYPTIDVPTDSWLRHAILYWDEVSSIIPKDHDGNLLGDLSPEVKYLISEGEFKAVHPEQLISGEGNRGTFRKFESEFIEIVNNPMYIFFVQQNYYGRYKKNVGQIHWSSIHRNKISDSLYYSLEEKGLAKATEKYQWLKFETNTALLYMSLLAKHLAEIQKDFTTIGTDLGVYEKLNFKPAGKNQGIPVISYLLKDLLPVAEENVPLEKILFYKRKRKDNLLRFRKVLNSYQKEISKTSSMQEVKELTIHYSEEIRMGVRDLKATLKDAKINARVKSIKSLISLQTPQSIIAVGALAADALNTLPSQIAIPVAAATGVIEFGFNYIENRIQQRSIIRDSAFSYVYEAQKTGIIKRTK